MWFQQPLVNALADFGREQTFVARSVVGRESKKVGLPGRQIADCVGCDCSDREGRAGKRVQTGLSPDIDLVAGEIRLSVRAPHEDGTARGG